MNLVDELLRDRGDCREPALITPGGEVIEFADLAARVERTARALAGAGLAAGRGPVPRVGLACPDGLDYVVLALALLRRGACLVPIATELTPRERSDLARRVALDWVVASAPGVDGGTPLADVPGRGVRLVRSEAVAERAPEFSEEAFAALAPAFVRFSSGTTGTAKGIVLSHPTLRARIAAAQQTLGIGDGDRVVWLLPMAHHFVASVLLYLWSGATIVLVPSPLAADVLEVARRHGGTVLYAAPFHHALLAAEASGRPWPDLRRAFSTATRLPGATARGFLARYGRPLVQVLGLMEVGLAAANLGRAAEKPEAVGPPAPGFELEIRSDRGEPLPRGEVGELHVRGPGMLDAYLSPWRRRGEILRDGWFATGDLGRLDEDGDLFLVGRSHSVIDVGGLKCFPEEIEAVLEEHPGVLGARVKPRPHARLGALPVAEVVPADGAHPPDPAVLARHCRDRLARYKVPVEFRLVGELASTPSGKLRR